MTAKKPSHEQHDTTATNPFAAFAAVPGMDAWRSIFDAQTSRFEKALGEMERLERERHMRTVTAIDDMTQLFKSSLEYQRELATEWRKMGVDAAKKGAELVGAS